MPSRLVQKRLDRLRNADRYIREEEQLEEGSEHPFFTFPEISQAKIPFIRPYYRVSSYDQSPRPQRVILTRRFEQIGITVLEGAGGVETGKSLERKDRKLLYRLLDRMKEEGGGHIGVVDLTRLTRNPKQNTSREWCADLRPEKHQIGELQQIEKDFLVTFVILNPDKRASPCEGNAFIEDLHEECKRLGGRPPKGKRLTREETKLYQELAWGMFKKGSTHQQISEEIQRRSGKYVSRRTIGNWLLLFYE